MTLRDKAHAECFPDDKHGKPRRIKPKRRGVRYRLVVALICTSAQGSGGVYMRRQPAFA